MKQFKFLVLALFAALIVAGCASETKENTEPAPEGGRAERSTNSERN